MIIGGIVEIYKRTDTVGAAINSVLRVSENLSQMIIAVVMIVFFILEAFWDGGAYYPFVPIHYNSLAISLWDTIPLWNGEFPALPV